MPGLCYALGAFLGYTIQVALDRAELKPLISKESTVSMVLMPFTPPMVTMAMAFTADRLKFLAFFSILCIFLPRKKSLALCSLSKKLCGMILYFIRRNGCYSTYAL